ncbi:hypothetical protein [Mucilaginibacter sp. PAMB04168]|uniref:hypothetical protein n=1 Tax=Mucilaginibacter sp. PAMB04168 TaxID=3138567 RepID=UPI0031F6A268
MNKLFTAVVGLALSATALSASAQKSYTEGLAVYEANGMEGKVYFKGDSSATLIQSGPAAVKRLAFKDEYSATVIDVPVASIKWAAVATPGELEEELAGLPSFTFTPTSETKVINGFKCTKVTAKDTKSNTTYDTWVTKDISAPSSAFGMIYAKAGGFPVQFTMSMMGQTITNTLKAISDSKAPAGTFGIPAGFERITMTELKARSPKR